MTTESAIKEKLEQFLSAWEDRENRLEECISKEPYVYFSTFGIAYTEEQIRGFFSRKKSGTKLSLKIMNHTILCEGEKASQFANVIGIIKDQSYFQKHLVFGGTFVNELVKEAGEWKLKVVRFDLKCEDSVGKTSLSREGLITRITGYGDSSMIGDWKKIDDRIGHNMTAIPGTAAGMISPDYDTPWYAVKNPDNKCSDEEAVKELLCKYGYAIDFATFPLLTTVFDENVRYETEKINWSNRRDAIGYLKMYRKTIPRSFHAFVYEKIEIKEHEAFVSARRISPDLKTMRNLPENENEWTEGIYQYKAGKKDSRWLITDLKFSRV